MQHSPTDALIFYVWETHEAWVKDTGEMTMINDRQGVMLVSKDGTARMVREGRYGRCDANVPLGCCVKRLGEQRPDLGRNAWPCGNASIVTDRAGPDNAAWSHESEGGCPPPRDGRMRGGRGAVERAQSMSSIEEAV